MKNKNKSHLPMIVIFTVIFYCFNRLSYVYRLTPERMHWLNRVLLLVNSLNTYIFGMISFHTTDLTVGIGAVLLVWVVATFRFREKKNFREGEEYGSARWGTKEDIKPFLSKSKRNRILLSDTESIPFNEKPSHPKYGRNKNVLGIGSPGSGKSRYFLKPNLLQFNSSYVMTDPKGELLRDTAPAFRKMGFKIKFANFIHLALSMGYNFFHYMKTTTDILITVRFLMENTTNNQKNGGDPFWEKAEQLLFMALIGYMFEVCSKDEFHVHTLTKIMTALTVTESDSETDNAIDQLFKEHEESNPESFAVLQFKRFREHASGKTAKTILLSMEVRLMPFDIPEVRKATTTDELELDKIGDEKTVLYLLVPDTHSTFDFLIGLLYNQLFNSLVRHADQQPEGELKIPVQCYLDEFANIGKIPDVERLMATVRSRNISINPIIQNIPQLEARYEKSWKSIVGTCDSQVFLGGDDDTTTEYISKMLGEETIDERTQNKTYSRERSWSDNNKKLGRKLMKPEEIAQMDNEYSIVNIRGVPPFKSRKIRLENHPNYHLLEEGTSNSFNAKEYLGEYRANQAKQGKSKTIKLKANNVKGKEEEYEVTQLSEKEVIFDPLETLKKKEAKSA